MKDNRGQRGLGEPKISTEPAQGKELDGVPDQRLNEL
jgi:hypothetical protein